MSAFFGKCRLLLLMPFVCGSAIAEEAIPSYEDDFFSAPLDRLYRRTQGADAGEAIADLPSWGEMSEKTRERLANLWNWHDKDKLEAGLRQWLEETRCGKWIDSREMATVLIALQRWCGQYCWEDSLMAYIHFYRLCFYPGPIDTQEELDFLAHVGAYTRINTRELQAMHQAFSGKRPSVLARRDQTILNRMRLWSDPARYAQDIIRTQRQADWMALRMYLRDFKALTIFFRQSGLRVVGKPRGVEMPESGVLAQSLFEKHHEGGLIAGEEAHRLLQPSDDLPEACLGMPVRAVLALNPGASPWKVASVGSKASPFEMPDCSATALPQWSAALLGRDGADETVENYLQWADEELAELKTVVSQLQEARLLRAAMKDVFAGGIQEMKEATCRSWMSRVEQGWPNEKDLGKTAAREVAEAEKEQEKVKAAARLLLVRAHRLFLQLSWVAEHARNGRVLEKPVAALAQLCNEYGLWPLVVYEREVMKLDSLVEKSLFARFSGHINHLTLLVDNEMARRYAATMHKPIHQDKLVEGHGDTRVLGDELPSSEARKKEVAERWMRVAAGGKNKHYFPVRYLCLSKMDAVVNRWADIPVKGLGGNHSYTGFALIRQSIDEGNLERARALYEKMVSEQANYTFAETRLAKSLLDRADGREEDAKRSVQDALMIGVARLLDRYGSSYATHAALLRGGFLDELEKMMCFLSQNMPLNLLEEMADAWAARGQYTSACYDLEILVQNAVFKLAIQPSQSHANIVRWRLKADVCRGLALLQEGRREEGMRLVRSACAGMLENPVAAQTALPWVLTCGLISKEEREQIRREQIAALEKRTAESAPRRKVYNELALEALRKATVQDAPAVDKPADKRDFDRMLAESDPFRSDWLTWHILPEKSGDAGETVEGRIAAVEYECGEESAGVMILTRKGRYWRLPFTRLEAGDIRNVIEWKRQNGLRTWTPAAGNPEEFSTPQDGRLESVEGEPGGEVAVITGSTGFLYKVPLDRLSEEDKEYVRQWNAARTQRSMNER